MNDNLIPRRDFFNSLDLEYDQGEFIDLEECEILFLYFLEVNSLITIFKKFKKEYSEIHKAFLISKIPDNPDSCLFDFIVRDSSFNTLDFLSLLPVSFYRAFCKYLSKTNLFFLDTLLEFDQTLEAFEDPSLFSSTFLLNPEVDLLYNIIKKMICMNNKIKDNFIYAINLLIKNNQDRNKIMHNKEEVISDKEAYNLNLLISKFLITIIRKDLPLEGKFSRFVFTSKIEIFKISFIKMIEEIKILMIEDSKDERILEIDEILKEIVNEKEFGDYLGRLILSHYNNNTIIENIDTIINVYLYIFEFLPPDYSILSFLFQFDFHKQHILRILVHNPNIIKFSLLNKIIEYYNKIQKEPHKIEVRYLINMILVENNTLILKTCPRNIKFINYLMSDFEYCLSKGLSGISELNNNNSNNHSIIRNCFIFIDTCFRLLNKIINISTDILLVDELISVFVKILNCNMRTIVGPRCSELVIKNKVKKERLNFNPKELLRNILLIYIGIKKDKFIKAVCREEMYFDIELFKVGLEICENKYLLNQSQLADLSLLIDQFDKNMINNSMSEEEEGFIDPLTYNIIKDPVKLLTSNITIDKSTYNMIMLNDGIDPFNREPLDDSKVVEDLEMKEEIKKRNSK